MSESTPVLRLRKNEERRLKAGHDWIYANEVDTGETPVKSLPAGAAARVEDARGKPLGRALLSPNSLIVGRLYSRDPEQEPSRSFFKKRIEQALALRETLFPAPGYRLVHGEADGLPGLVVDRYDDTLVLQAGTAGMEAHLDTVVSALDAVLSPTNIVVRNEAGVRELEDLPLYTRALKGDVPESVTLSENGGRFTAPLREGQKTGWFFDHRAARARMAPLARDARVLDVFAYCGGWGVQAALAGAREVTGVDSSGLALDYMHRNAELNGVGDRLRTLEGDAVAAMKELIADGEKFDLVILDPPAFIKRRKDFKNGLAGYHAINELAVRLVKPGGYLISASCSMHLPADKLLDVMRASARHIDRALQIIGQEGQGPDHPVQPAMPETAYLKSWFGRLLFRF
ncbi:class I SAM-dependent rRNA methyltransferase [Alloalcanivorax marinus]|uniref:class I SAM-dependent rRNA methyltransferase n=1 Tax=Alloalcanivorax marinus TaxID=1177169 RepID=UPI00195C43F3|nr:class I SAM-dependent rRNA methyltransferase [Alloalcanivorax marinus]MBM7335266.1 class I SAM-dependent rRNA methyltransferase [Alloalcanivorax marinus]